MAVLISTNYVAQYPALKRMESGGAVQRQSAVQRVFAKKWGLGARPFLKKGWWSCSCIYFAGSMVRSWSWPCYFACGVAVCGIILIRALNAKFQHAILIKKLKVRTTIASSARTTRELRARTHPRTTRRARLAGVVGSGCGGVGCGVALTTAVNFF